MEKKIRELIKSAMIEKNKEKQITYKNILECAQKIAKKTNVEITDDMFVSAIKNEIKQLKDILEYCEDGSERSMEVKRKIDYCMTVLPKMVTSDEISKYLIENVIQKNMGACMKALKEKFGSNMDNKMASNIVKQYINT